LLWNARHPDVVRGLLGSKPLQDPALADRFTQMAAACQIAVPRFEQVDMRGGVVANAVALASLRGSALSSPTRCSIDSTRSSSSSTSRPSAFIGSTRPEPGLLLAEPHSMPWEILLGRAAARCVHPAAAWQVASARGRAALVGAYFGAGYAVALAALLAL
jgi:hypothetical protein